MILWSGFGTNLPVALSCTGRSCSSMHSASWRSNVLDLVRRRRTTRRTPRGQILRVRFHGLENLDAQREPRLIESEAAADLFRFPLQVPDEIIDARAQGGILARPRVQIVAQGLQLRQLEICVPVLLLRDVICWKSH